MEQFRAEHGERLIILATPNIPSCINSHDGKKAYTRELLRPFRYFGEPHSVLFKFQRRPKFQPTNVHFFYEQINQLWAYWTDEITDDSPVHWHIEQFEKGDFTPDRFLLDSLWELASWSWATSIKSTLLMIGICQNEFRSQVLSLLNTYSEEKPIFPEEYENGQIHILRLWYKDQIDILLQRMGRPNKYTNTDIILECLLAIQFTQNETISLCDFLPEINFWQIMDVRYAAYRWNEVHEWVATMKVVMDYSQPENIILQIQKVV